MGLFRVLGAKQVLYSTIVSADSKLEAYDIADARNTNDWDELETDNVIEVIEIEEEEQD